MVKIFQHTHINSIKILNFVLSFNKIKIYFSIDLWRAYIAEFYSNVFLIL